MLQVLAKALHGETTCTKLLFQRTKGPAKLPESVLPLFALYPVLIQPKLVVGGPEPESAAVRPRRCHNARWMFHVLPTARPCDTRSCRRPARGFRRRYQS